MKKVAIFLAIVIVLFVALAVVNNMQNNQKVEENNIYKKDKLHPETIAQLDDPNYQNIILPEELDERLANQEDLTVYFFSPTCPHCVATTPIVAPLAKEMGIDLKQFNLLEFDDGWDKYGIEQTPTIIQYKGGKEVARIIGSNDEATFEAWFNENSK